MSTTTQVPEVTDYLVAACQASATIGAATPKTYVFDGPQPSRTMQGVQRALWIGHNPASAGEVTATTEQDWPNLDHARTLDEEATIICAAQHWDGDPTIKTLRDRCAATVGAVDLLLRGGPLGEGPGDTTMGGLVFWSRVAGPDEWYPMQLTNGASVLCVFRIIYQARLVSS